MKYQNKTGVGWLLSVIRSQYFISESARYILIEFSIATYADNCAKKLCCNLYVLCIRT
jgi:hypothetical protein